MSKKTDHLHYWKSLWSSGKNVPKKAAGNPKFVFSFFIIMAISSAGVWAPWAFEINLSPACSHETIVDDSAHNIDSKIKVDENSGVLQPGLSGFGSGNIASTGDVKSYKSSSVINSCDETEQNKAVLFPGFAIFMFNLGLLGGIAFEFFARQGPQKYHELDFDKVKINELRINEFGGFFIWLFAFILSFYGLKEPTTQSIAPLLGSLLSLALWVFTNYDKTEFQQPEPEPSNIEAGNEQQELQGDGLK